MHADVCLGVMCKSGFTFDAKTKRTPECDKGGVHMQSPLNTCCSCLQRPHVRSLLDLLGGRLLVSSDPRSIRKVGRYCLAHLKPL